MLDVKVYINLEALADIALEKAQAILKDTCENAEVIARENFATAKYDGVNDVTVNLEKIDDGYSLSAQGNSVYFIEYGSGVSFKEQYPIEKPVGVSDIGEYGKGKGKNPPWIFKNDGTVQLTSNGSQDLGNGFYLTYGNPPCMAMYKAFVAIKEMGR